MAPKPPAAVAAKPPAPAVARPKRRRWRLLLGLALLLVFLWLVPKIVAWTPLRNTVMQNLFARLDGTIDIGGAGLGWFSPIVLDDVTITTADGGKVLYVQRLESSRTLLGLLFDSHQLGRFRIDKPELHLRTCETGSNVETVIAKYLARPPESSPATGRTRHLELEIIDGIVRVDDDVTREHWLFEPVTASFQLAPGGETPCRLEFKARGGRDGAPGKLDIDLTTTGDQGTCTLEGDDVPVTALNLLLRRSGAGIALSGGMRAKCTARWGGDGEQPRLQLDGNIAAKRITVSGPWLGGERLRLEKVELPCRLAAVGSRLHFEQARLSCDLGYASLRGGFNLSGPPGDWLGDPGWAIIADVDVARLANQLPATLGLRAGTELTAGRLKLDCHSRAERTGVVCEGKLNTTALKGRRGGRTLSWPEPMAVDFRVRRQGASDPVLEHLRCQSRFLRLQGSGSSEQISVHADVDLKELAEPLSQFVDLGDFRLAGQGTADVAIRALGKDAYAIESRGRFQNLQLGGLSEPSVDAKLTARWDASADTLNVSEATWQSPKLTLKSPRLRVTAVSSEQPELVGLLTLDGDLARLHSWLRGPETPKGSSALAYALPVLAGVTEAQGRLSLQLDSARIPLTSPDHAELTGKLTVHSARVGAAPLVRELAGLFKVPPLGVQVRESVVPIRVADGKVHHKDLDLIFPEMTVRTSGWVALDGTLSLIAELPTPARWLGTSKLSPALGKQKIHLPIRGTLDRPRLDDAALRDAMTRVVRESAGNLLQHELENRLKNLMKK